MTGVAVRAHDATLVAIAGGTLAAASLSEIPACSGSIRKKDTKAARALSNKETS